MPRLDEPLLPRRRLLGLLAVASPAIAGLRRRAVLAVRQIDLSTLAALARVALPNSLSSEERQAVVTGFERWLAAYRGGAELLHGYGTDTIRRSPASPAPKWRAQLRALEQAAQRHHRRSFAEISHAEGIGLLETALEDIHAPLLPAIVTAPHVALGLLAFYIDLPTGYDRAYGGHIQRFGCRPLAKNPDRPEPLGEKS